MSFTVVSLFAGCGGSSLGYKLAGGRVLLASEWDPHAAATYRANHAGTDLVEGDIGKLSVDDILSRTGLQPGQLDILDGSPPCQGFSTVGKREFHDPRNQLFREYVRVLKGLRPRVFVMENVSGMVKSKMKLIFADVLRELRGCGYTVAARLMNAMYYRVPQSRERVIFIGVRSELGVAPSHPLAQCRPITVREAWTSPTDIRHERGREVSPKVAALAKLIPPGDSNGGGKYSLGLNGNTNYFGLCRLAWDRPSFTICKAATRTACTMHPDHDCQISIAQAKRICSFPDSFQLMGSFSEQWARLGNSVPPNFMRAIAEHVRDSILAPLAQRRAA